MIEDKLTNLPEILLQLKNRYQKSDVLLYKKAGKFLSISANNLYTIIEQIAAGLLSMGIRKNDKVAIISENRPEWAFADMAIMSIGAVTVPVFPDFSASQICYILNDSESKIVFVSCKEAAPKVAKITKKTHLRTIFSFDLNPPSGILLLELLINEGKLYIENEQFSLYENIKSVKNDDLATIVYTSGTTGDPKGVMLTHRNILSNIESFIKSFHLYCSDISISFLPLSHILERTAGYYTMLYSGVTISYAESLNKLPDNLKEFKPTLLIGVPRFYEKIQDMILSTIHKAPFHRKYLFNWALKIGKITAPYRKLQQKLPFSLALKFFFANKLVYKKVLARMGGKLRLLISGGAHLPKETAEFFYYLNILILEGYGLTETSPVISVNTPHEFKFGTIGKPIPGVAVRIAEDGEIVAKGKNVMTGYFNKPDETKAVLKDGWLFTGDYGHIDDEGFLSITDRKKDLIVSAAGKKISPQSIENAIRKSKYISEIVIVGDDQKYLCALIIPNYDKCFEYAKNQQCNFASKSELCESPLIRNLIQNELNAISANFSPYEKIKKFALIKEEFKIAEEELTPTLKIRRKAIQKKYQSLINSLYTE